MKVTISTSDYVVFDGTNAKRHDEHFMTKKERRKVERRKRINELLNFFDRVVVLDFANEFEELITLIEEEMGDNS